jgi:hypothetical protein
MYAPGDPLGGATGGVKAKVHAQPRVETVGAVQLGFPSVPPVTLMSAVKIDGCKHSAEDAF